MFENVYGDKLDFGAMKVAKYRQVNKKGAQSLKCFERSVADAPT